MFPREHLKFAHIVMNVLFTKLLKIDRFVKRCSQVEAGSSENFNSQFRQPSKRSAQVLKHRL